MPYVGFVGDKAMIIVLFPDSQGRAQMGDPFTFEMPEGVIPKSVMICLEDNEEFCMKLLQEKGPKALYRHLTRNYTYLPEDSADTVVLYKGPSK